VNGAVAAMAQIFADGNMIRLAIAFVSSRISGALLAVALRCPRWPRLAQQLLWGSLCAGEFGRRMAVRVIEENPVT
jgi:hypothetical protein